MKRTKTLFRKIRILKSCIALDTKNRNKSTDRNDFNHYQSKVIDNKYLLKQLKKRIMKNILKMIVSLVGIFGLFWILISLITLLELIFKTI